MKSCFLKNYWVKDCKRINGIIQKRFFYGMFYSWVFANFPKTSQDLDLGWRAGHSSWGPSVLGTHHGMQAFQ